MKKVILVLLLIGVYIAGKSQCVNCNGYFVIFE